MGDSWILLSSENELYKFCKADSGALKFQVKSIAGQAALTLISKNKPHKNLFKIQLNEQSVIIDLTNDQVQGARTPEVVLTDFKQFWLTWFKNRISIGLVNNFQPLLTIDSATNTNAIGYVRFETRSAHTLHSTRVDWKIENTPLMPTIPPKRISGGSLEWIYYENELPPNAVIGGVEGVPLYVARAHHAGVLAPGKYCPVTKATYIPWCRRIHKYTEFEILCGLDVEWRFVKENYVPPNAVIGGYSQYGLTPLYVGRAYYDGHLLIGNVDPLAKTCYLPYKDREIEVYDYEIMISKSIPTRGIQLYGQQMEISAHEYY